MLGKIQAENIVIFVSDSLRWDYLPDEIRDMGMTFKSIASSLYTASSFPSIISGLYPNQHKVLSFHHQFPDGVATMLNLPGYNTSFWTGNTWVKYEPRESAPIFRNVGHDRRISLEDIQPPFIYVEDDKGGHAPYGYSFHDYDSYTDFYKEHLDEKTLKSKYRQSVKISADNFHNRIQVLKDRNLLDRTLVIFTSDHGELLGEYGGLVGHSYPACPELVFVPACFIHRDLECSFHEDGVIRHVDLTPTAMSVLGERIPDTMQGIDLTEAETLPRMGYNYASVLGGTYEASSVWGRDGGYAFYRLPFRKRVSFSLNNILRGGNCTAFRGKLRKSLNLLSAMQNSAELLKHLGSHHIRYLSPKFSVEEAKSLMEAVEKCTTFIESKMILSEKTEERLRNLGYMD